MRLAICVALAGTLGCSGGREKQCTDARDRAIPLMQQRIDGARAEVAPEMRARFEQDAAMEMVAFKANFVGVCTKHTNVDPACAYDEAKADSAACKDQWRPLWPEVYRPVK